MAIDMPEMNEALVVSWHALMDLSEQLPKDTWTVVGGQMVHIHCAERGVFPSRATDDVDSLLDVRASPTILYDFTKILKELNFNSAGETPEGHQHRWMNGDAQIDVLIGNHLGLRASQRKGINGATTLSTPGAAHVLKRSEAIKIRVAGREGTVRRPTLIGALIAKAAVHSVETDIKKGRHRVDFVVLASLATAQDLRKAKLSVSERKYLSPMITAASSDARALEVVPESREALDRLSRI